MVIIFDSSSIIDVPFGLDVILNDAGVSSADFEILSADVAVEGVWLR